MDVTASDIARDDMAQFTRNVQAWLQLDAQVTEMSKSVRSRRRLQRQLSSIILDFMQKHNIEDLNTSEGTLRCKVRTGQAPLMLIGGGAATKLVPITDLPFETVDSLIFDGLLQIQSRRLPS
jgi:uncharacterized protein (DUF1919 family)